MGLRPSGSFPFATAALALAACVGTLLAGLFVEGGHPPLADFVGAFAVPAAWLIGLTGIVAAVLLRGSAPRRRLYLGIACNLAAMVAGLCVWLFWPFIRSG